MLPSFLFKFSTISFDTPCFSFSDRNSHTKKWRHVQEPISVLQESLLIFSLQISRFLPLIHVTSGSVFLAWSIRFGFHFLKQVFNLFWQEKGDAILKRAECRAKGGAPGFKVAILGAAGGIGQSLSLLMKINPLVSVLHLYDVVNTPGVTADISHMDTGAVVNFFSLNYSLSIKSEQKTEL